MKVVVRSRQEEGAAGGEEGWISACVDRGKGEVGIWELCVK